MSTSQGLRRSITGPTATAYVVPSQNNDRLMGIFHSECEKHGILHDNEEIFRYMRTFDTGQHAGQLTCSTPP